MAVAVVLCPAHGAGYSGHAVTAPAACRRARRLRALRLGKLYRRTGKRDQAQDHLTIATTMYREMDMGFWLEQAEAEMRELA